MDRAFTYVYDNGGICTWQAYPYTGTNGECQGGCPKVAALTAYRDLPSGREDIMLQYSVQQPISIGVEADHQSFQVCFIFLCG
jgi:cathepsin L